MSRTDCLDCGRPLKERVVSRCTKRYCDGCLRRHKNEQERHRKAQQRPRSGICPDCGGHSSQPGRRCDPCGRKIQGQRKTANAEVRYEAQRRTALVLLMEWGRRHGGVGPTMAQWDDCGYWELPAFRVLKAFGSWSNALDAAGLEHQVVFHGRFERGRFARNRQMVVAGATDVRGFHDADIAR